MAGAIPLFDFASPKTTSGILDPKMHVSFGALQAAAAAAAATTSIDHNPVQTPSKKKNPWKTINDVTFVRSVDVVLPEELYDLIWDSVEARLKKVRCASVVMKLEEVLQGDFFTEYVKRGDVIMLSEGRPGVDNVFSLKDGILSLEMDKESYERAGLQGKPVRGGGRKHIKTRYLVEINLRLPSMLHGKKGFARIVWAAKNVLNRSLTWMFCDLQQMRVPIGFKEPASSPSPLDILHPNITDLAPTLASLEGCFVPTLAPEPQVNGNELSSALLSDWCWDITEWLGLAALESSLLKEGDNTDPYISRYGPPKDLDAPSITLKILKWRGLIPARWITDLLVASINQSRIDSTRKWIGISATAHRTQALGQTDGYTILLTSSKKQQEDSNGEASATATRDLRAEDRRSDRGETLPRASSSKEQQPSGTSGSKKEKNVVVLDQFTCFQFVDSAGF